MSAKFIRFSKSASLMHASVKGGSGGFLLNEPNMANPIMLGWQGASHPLDQGRALHACEDGGTARALPRPLACHIIHVKGPGGNHVGRLCITSDDRAGRRYHFRVAHLCLCVASIPYREMV